VLRKIFGLTFFLLVIISMPVFADVKVESDTIVGWNDWRDATADYAWNSGFITTGNWSLGPKLAFFVKDQVAINQADQQWQGTLDRAYFQYEQDAVRLNLGRQGVTWGIGWFFRPTDLITPLTPLAEEDTRPGKDLAVLRWSTSPLTATDFIAGDQIGAVRSEWRIGLTNLRLLGVCQPGYINGVGYDFQGGLAGIYGEGAYRWADDAALDQGKFVGLLGWKKVIGSGNQLYIEYYLNDLSKAGSELYQRLFLQNKNHEFIYASQNYLAVGYQIPWDQLTNLTLAGIANLDDQGTILEGIADVQFTDNLELQGTLMTVIGPDGTEFCPVEHGYKVGAKMELKYFF
jgi:hypothetical protein